MFQHYKQFDSEGEVRSSTCTLQMLTWPSSGPHRSNQTVDTALTLHRMMMLVIVGDGRCYNPLLVKRISE